MRRLSAELTRGARVATALITVLTLGACNDEAAPSGPNTDGGEAAVNTIVTTGPLNGSSNDTLIAF
ncbi:MAG: hypothetical protein ABI852_12300, partial [Gemmatimonadaceae bacterium]